MTWSSWHLKKLLAASLNGHDGESKPVQRQLTAVRWEMMLTPCEVVLCPWEVLGFWIQGWSGAGVVFLWFNCRVWEKGVENDATAFYWVQRDVIYWQKETLRCGDSITEKSVLTKSAPTLGWECVCAWALELITQQTEIMWVPGGLPVWWLFGIGWVQKRM